MARSIDEIENESFTLEFRFVAGIGPLHTNWRELDGNTTFLLEIHRVEHLTVFHVPLFDRLGDFKKSVGQGGFSMVDVGDNTEISNIFSFHGRVASRTL